MTGYISLWVSQSEEASYPGYARQLVSDSVDGIEFPQCVAGASTTTIVGFAIHAGDDQVFWAAIDPPVVVYAGVTPKVAVQRDGDMVSFADIMADAGFRPDVAWSRAMERVRRLLGSDDSGGSPTG